MLDERKQDAINLILQGENKTNVSKLVGINRTTLYEWLKTSEVKEQMETQRQELIQCGSEKLTARLNTYLENLHDIALTSKDQRTKATVNMYLVDHVIGKSTTHIMNEDKTKDKDYVSVDVLEKELREFDRLEEELKGRKQNVTVYK